MAAKKTTRKAALKSVDTSVMTLAETREMYKMQIEGLRTDKIVYAVESVAVSILALLVFIGAPSVFPEIINPYEPSSLKMLQGVIIFPLAYWLFFAVIGNLIRLAKIQKLTKKLRGL
jgi:surface polysaccharide O-acyltransferase-like enzyme